MQISQGSNVSNATTMEVLVGQPPISKTDLLNNDRRKSAFLVSSCFRKKSNFSMAIKFEFESFFCFSLSDAIASDSVHESVSFCCCRTSMSVFYSRTNVSCRWLWWRAVLVIRKFSLLAFDSTLYLIKTKVIVYDKGAKPLRNATSKRVAGHLK